MQPHFHRQQSGVQIPLSSEIEGTGTPVPPSQQINVSAEAKALIKSMLTVDADRRPSALDILLGSAWVQAQMSPQDVESLNMMPVDDNSMMQAADASDML